MTMAWPQLANLESYTKKAQPWNRSSCLWWDATHLQPGHNNLEQSVCMLIVCAFHESGSPYNLAILNGRRMDTLGHSEWTCQVMVGEPGRTLGVYPSRQKHLRAEEINKQSGQKKVRVMIRESKIVSQSVSDPSVISGPPGLPAPHGPVLGSGRTYIDGFQLFW